MKRVSVFAICAFSTILFTLSATLGAARAGEVSTAEQAALDRISADSLRADVSYLASDQLEGRNTPSPGLDMAAGYIAAQFRREGLQPAASDGSYFQRAQFDQALTNPEGFHLSFRSGSQKVEVPKAETMVKSLTALDYTEGAVVKLPANGTIPAVAGMIVAGARDRWEDEALLEKLESRGPALVLLFGKTIHHTNEQRFLDDLSLRHPPVIRIDDAEANAFFEKHSQFEMNLHLGAPTVKQVELRNVAGVLPGEDDALRGQYVMVSAHYDHLGRGPRGILHGANDNASGTASVIQIAAALAALNPHPKRSILFIAYFGEEEGLLGSYYYAHSPLVPLRDTVANINLEQMGRTDDERGKKLLSFTITGPSYSTVPGVMSEAAKAEGVGIWSLPNADDYFERSDNYALAQRGVIAHTIAVAAEFPDYHETGDRWERIDFENMAKVDRGVAAGVLRLADETGIPHWTDAPGATIYRQAKP